MAKDTESSEPTSDRRERRARTIRAQAQAALNALSPTPAVRAPEQYELPTAAQARPVAHGAEAARSKPAPDTKSSSGAPANFAALPEGILDRYYRIGAKYYLDNGELAFTHRADKLTTPSENTEIIRDLVEIARHNGVHDITVTGTERFRRQAWAAATRLGIEVRGYEPTLHDEKQLVRAMAREEGSRRGARGAGAGSAPEGEAAAAAGSGALPPATPSSGIRGAPRAAADRRAPGQGRAYMGELLDH